MRLPRRTPAPLVVPAGERILAWTTAGDDTVVGGTRDALYIAADPVVPTRIPWEQVEGAEWDVDTSVLRVSEVGEWGGERPVHALVIDEPGRLLELVRERVTASIVLQRHMAVVGASGVRVIARRAPRGHRPLQWFFEYDEGVDPADPLVRLAAGEALAAARDEVGGA